MKKWIVSYYRDEKGGCQISDFLYSLPINQQAKAAAWISQLEEQGPNLPRPFADILTNGIHELRIKLSGNNERILYFFIFGNHIILAHQFIKQSQKVPEKEIKKAQKIRKEFKERFKNLNEYQKYLKSSVSHDL